MENKKRRWLIPILILLALLLGTYAGGVHYATQKFLPNTSILGIDVSGKTSAELRAKIGMQTGIHRISLSMLNKSRPKERV